ncbi:hypothetical protein SAMN05660916_01181 [Arthrobacter sp. 31Cvi3.1E]|nr:hypothetical protein SAMN05660916_01181 [Arthrobacter sp. 31Cvi3.1E]
MPRANPSARCVPTPRPASSVYDPQTDGRHGYALTTPKCGWHQSVCVAQVGKVGAGQFGWPPQPGGPPSWLPRGARFRPKGTPQSAESQPLGERCAPKVPRANPSAKGAPPKCLEPTPRRKVCPQSAESQPLGERARGQKKAGAAWERIPRRLHQLLVRLSVKSCDTYPLAAPSSRLRFVSGLQCQSGGGGLPRENTSHLTATSRKKR